MAMLDAFCPRPYRESLPLSKSGRIPYLVWTDLILIAYFIAGALARVTAEPEN